MLRILRLLGLAAAVTVLLALTAACDHGPGVRVENLSDKVVVVYEDGTPTVLMQPGVAQEFWVPKFQGTAVYEIRALDGGEILAKRSFTWEELDEEDGITIVVQ
jgi:hypothetical protein